MKKNFQKIVLIIFTIMFIKHDAIASTLSFKMSTDNVDIKEQFYVDVMLDTGGKEVNGVEGSIHFPENVDFLRAEEGKSMISMWIEKPKILNNKIYLSGIIPNGFSGVIDPFNPDKKLPGLIVRLVFEGKSEGSGDFLAKDFLVTLNDGLGTIDSISEINVPIFVKSTTNESIYTTGNDLNPELYAYITRDPNLYDNKYALIFEAKDKQTGIKEVLIKEGRKSWKKIESPYLLEDQSRHSIITLQATNYSDSSIVISIEALPRNIFSITNILIAAIAIIVLVIIFKKIYGKDKNKSN